MQRKPHYSNLDRDNTEIRRNPYSRTQAKQNAQVQSLFASNLPESDERLSYSRPSQSASKSRSQSSSSRTSSTKYAAAARSAAAAKSAAASKSTKQRASSQRKVSQRTTTSRTDATRSASAKSATARSATTKSASAKSAAARSSSARKRSRKKKTRLVPFAVIAIAAIAAIVALVIVFASAKVSEPLNVKISSSENTQTITWKRKGKNISFEIQQKGADGNYTTLKTIPEDGSTTCTAEGLQSATEYSYKITAIKGSGEKAKRSSGVEVKAYTLPKSVTALNASTESKDSLTFTWNDPQKLTGYELKYSPNEDFSDAVSIQIPLREVEKEEGSDVRSYMVPDLPEGNTYYYQFRSQCGDSVYSEWLPVASAKVTHAIDMTGIDVNAPMVAITFDDGPEGYDITTRILDAFAAVGGHATFFQLGDRTDSNPEKIQRMIAEGHEVGNHTYDHTHMGDAVTADDIISCSNSIEAACGVRPTCFRSPGGNTTNMIKEVCASEGMALFYWSVDTRDWSSRDADAVVTSIKNNTEDGDIILMHNIYDSTAEAVERILPWLKEQGYQLVTVPQLLKAKSGQLPTPGVEYITATQIKN